MSEMMKRRTFLKTAGAVAAALAASGVLTACGGDAPAPAPAPSTGGSKDFRLEMNGFTLTSKGTLTFQTVYRSTAKDTPIPGWGGTFYIDTDEGYTFTKDNFSVKADGTELTSYIGIWDRIESASNSAKQTLTDTLTVKSGTKGMMVSVYFQVSPELYRKGGKLEVTIKDDQGKSHTTSANVAGRNFPG